MKNLSCLMFVSGWLLFAAGCDDTDPQKEPIVDAAERTDGNIDLATKVDAGNEQQDGAQLADGEVKADGAQQSEIPNGFGFIMRTPKPRTLDCPASGPMPAGEREQPDLDWICTFDYDGEKGHVYIQNTPVECKPLGMSTGIVFQAGTSQLFLQSKLTPLTDAVYDWGGNHINDSLGFAYQGKFFKYYHSSFGYGWRKCQPMDCLQVFKTKDSTEMILDGCTKERKLPAVCRLVEVGQSYQTSDFSDVFKPCPGDPNYR